jgi:pyruvate,water dikinase
MSTDGAQPIVLELADPAALQLDLTGGKGSSLARLAAAGLPVPGGFHVTTDAYRSAVRGAPQEAIVAAARDVDAGRPETHEAAAARIARVFAALEIPAPVADAVRAGYEGMRISGEADDLAVAVRSSATAEDLPGMSFAGQQDSFLNIRGEDALLRAVRDCWASLWTARAIGYRARHGIPAADVTLAVVVQSLVDADAAGVLFTLDPMTGARDRVLINAAWGLGEAVVGGRVTPDSYSVSRPGGAVEVTVGTKEVRTVRTGDGTRDEPVPAELRDAPSLTDEQAARLADLGVRIEELYGTPMDVEWAVHDGEPFVLQARPVTGAAGGVLTEVWNDSLRGDYLWTSANLGEAIPSVMTPLTWALVRIFMENAMATPDLQHPMYGNIGGRFYMNLSIIQSVGHAFGMQRITDEAAREVFGRLPGQVEIPLLPIGRWELLKAVVPVAVRTRRAIAAEARRLPAFLATAEQRGTGLRERAASATDAADLALLWRDELRPYLVEASRMLRAAGKQDGNALVLIRRDLRSLLGDTDANALTTGLGSAGAGLASLEPLLGLERVARGVLDKETYVRRFGHRAPDEFEVSVPRPAEDPAWLDRQLAGRGATDVDALLARQEQARAQAWERLTRRAPRRVASLRTRLARWSRTARDRESARSEVVRAFWALRAFAVRAGELTGLADDVFYLSDDELVRVLDNSAGPASTGPAQPDDVPREAVRRRRATYDQYRALPVYPAVIRGRFDPVRWAADPARRSDVYDEHGAQAAASDLVTGFPGAVGVVEGMARVVASAEEGVALLPGEILVTTVTNVGWTPLFPRAGAVVTDVGAPLSHAAIVARELGIPAVVGCGDATMRLHTGDLVRVDGEHGTVEVLEAAGAAAG